MKATVLGTIFFAWVSLGWCGTPFAEAVQQSQRAAVRAYPELGVEHSPLNDLFGSSYLTYQYNNPAYFKDDQWPLHLAKECVQELARREKEQAETEIRVQRERPAMEARMRAYKDFPVPEPTTTPFDSDAQKRKEYLAAYQDGYRQTLAIRRKIRFPFGPFSTHMKGWNAGVAAAWRDHPEIITTPAAPNNALQRTEAGGRLSSVSNA